MRLSAVLNCVAFASILTLTTAATAAPEPDIRVSTPIRHDNLAVYFVRGPSKAGPVPLTLEEALAKNVARVSETSNVNSLEIENLGDTPVFVQAGDIVKGGKQDRTLMVSLLLPPKSGRVSIASFCVEHGRWSPRGGEAADKFSTSTASVPSREMKMAMQAPMPASPKTTRSFSETGERQQKVWDGVQQMQHKLAGNVGGDVRAPVSASSLQLALENDKLVAMRKTYIDALQAAAKDDDIVGYVFAINGKLNSGDVYSSHALFTKMWPKLLTASAVEAIGQRNETAGEPPAVPAVLAFLQSADAGTVSAKPLNFGVNRVTHASPAAYMFETAKADGWVHKNYLAK